MTILDTNIQNFETEQAATEPLFDAAELAVPGEKLDPKKVAIEKAKSVIDSYTLLLIDRCSELEAQDELDQEQRMVLYDSKAAVRKTAGEVVRTLEEGLTQMPLKLGESWYFLIKDPHAKTGNHNQLIRLDDDSNVSFMEPRGLMGDDEFKLAQHHHNVRLIEDVIAESQAA